MLDRCARHFPSPILVGLPLRCMPPSLRHVGLARVLNHHLGGLIEADEFAELDGKTIAVRIADFDLECRIGFRDGQLVGGALDQPADAVIGGRAGDFLMLASSIEDPDTLFFERRLEVCGDTATGLLLRNLLDRVEPGSLPLALRVVLNRLGRFSQRLRRRRDESALSN